MFEATMLLDPKVPKGPKLGPNVVAVPDLLIVSDIRTELNDNCSLRNLMAGHQIVYLIDGKQQVHGFR